jgi:hypothetical protein
MYFFNNREDGLSKQNISTLGGGAIPVISSKRNMFDFLTGEETPLVLPWLSPPCWLITFYSAVLNNTGPVLKTSWPAFSTSPSLARLRIRTNNGL